MTIPLVDLATSGFILFAAIMREKIFKSSKTFARAQSRVPLKELSRVNLRLLSRLNPFQRIARSLPKFLIIPVELMYFVSNAFRKRTCKHERKRKSYDRNHRIN